MFHGYFSPPGRRLALGLAMVAVVALPASPAPAQSVLDRAYVELQGGIGWLDGSDLAIRNGATADGDADFDLGFAAGGALGLDLSERWAGELEYMYRSNDVDSFSGGIGGSSGDFASVAIMANLLYRFESPAGLLDGALTPYVGAGVGLFQEIDFDIAGGANAGEFEDSGGFAYQLMAGSDYRLSPSWALNGELRYFDGGSIDLDGPSGRRLEADYRTLSVMLGVRYDF